MSKFALLQLLDSTQAELADTMAHIQTLRQTEQTHSADDLSDSYHLAVEHLQHQLREQQTQWRKLAQSAEWGIYAEKAPHNPYRLNGYTANGNSTLLGIFDSHEQAMAMIQHRKADPQNIYHEFRIARVYQWQITAQAENGELDFCAQYATQSQAEQALARLQHYHSKVSLHYIGGIQNA